MPRSQPRCWTRSTPRGAAPAPLQPPNTSRSHCGLRTTARGRCPPPRRYNAQFAVSAALCDRVKKICASFCGGGGGGGTGTGTGTGTGMDALLGVVSLLQDQTVFKRELESRLSGLEDQYAHLLRDLEMHCIAVPADLKAGGGGGGGGEGGGGGPVWQRCLRGLDGASAIYRQICGLGSQPAAVEVAPA